MVDQRSLLLGAATAMAAHTQLRRWRQADEHKAESEALDRKLALITANAEAAKETMLRRAAEIAAELKMPEQNRQAFADELRLRVEARADDLRGDTRDEAARINRPNVKVTIW